MLPLSAQVSWYFSIEAAIFGRRNWAEAPGVTGVRKNPFESESRHINKIGHF